MQEIIANPAALNMGNKIGPMLLQPAIGAILDRRWTGAMAGNLRVYDVSHFQAAFMLIVGWSVLTVVLLGLTKETYCRATA